MNETDAEVREKRIYQLSEGNTRDYRRITDFVTGADVRQTARHMGLEVPAPTFQACDVPHLPTILEATCTWMMPPSIGVHTTRRWPQRDIDWRNVTAHILATTAVRDVTWQQVRTWVHAALEAHRRNDWETLLGCAEFTGDDVLRVLESLRNLVRWGAYTDTFIK